MNNINASAPPPRRKIIGIVGSAKEPHTDLVKQIVPWIAQQDFHLLTGARGGVMEEASREFQLARDAEGKRGLAIGVLPDNKGENRWVELLIRTHLPAGNHGSDFHDGRDPRSRNWIEVRTCDVLVALPGGGGTEAEISLAAEHGTPVILFGWSVSPLQRLGIQTSGFVRETRSSAEVQDFVKTHTTEPTSVGKRGWNKTPSWPNDRHWPSP